MHRSRNWSTPSPRCLVDASASRLLAGCLIVLGLLGAAAIQMTSCAWPVRVVVAGTSVLWAALLAAREWRQPQSTFVFRCDGAIELDGSDLVDARLDWQGPIAILRWKEGRRRRHRMLWPDVIDAGSRRELRLWTLECRPGTDAAAVAP